MSAYYRSEDGAFILCQGDCRELLRSFDFAFDTIFADPPYFLSSGGLTCKNGRPACVDKGDWDKPSTPEEMDAFNREWLALCREKLKPGGTLWASGTHHNAFSLAAALNELGFKLLNVITWVKTNPPPNISCRYFTHSTEYVLWARRDAKTPHYYNYELMRTLNGGRQMTDVWRFPAVAAWEKSCGKHPTQKPLSLLVRLLLASTQEGAWVLDPFSGSGTTGIAANLLGRKFLGLERETEFLDLARARKLELESAGARERFRRHLRDLAPPA